MNCSPRHLGCDPYNLEHHHSHWLPNIFKRVEKPQQVACMIGLTRVDTKNIKKHCPAKCLDQVGSYFCLSWQGQPCFPQALWNVVKVQRSAASMVNTMDTRHGHGFSLSTTIITPRWSMVGHDIHPKILTFSCRFIQLSQSCRKYRHLCLPNDHISILDGKVKLPT